MKKVVSNLFFTTNNQLVCKGKNGKACPVFKKQGSLDGACATYSVIMNLLILSVISDSDTRIYVEHKNKDVKNLFKVFCNDYGMHRDGQTFFKIRRMLLESFGKYIDIKHTNTKNSGWQSLDNIVSALNTDIPVVISVSNSTMCHAMLAVGYEKIENNITRILCLDPSGNYIHGKKRWNATINIDSERKRPFRYESVLEGNLSNSYVELDDILIISKL